MKRASQVFHGMGGHQSAKPETVNWMTPPHIIGALGGADSFDLDPAAPFRSAIRTARRAYSWVFQDGLLLPWFGRVWLNPPYTDGEIAKWMGRLAEHGRGMALIFARTETENFRANVWDRASGLLFLHGRMHFHHLNGKRAKRNAGAPSVLCAYGDEDRDVLAHCGLAGQFIPLRLPRGFLIAAVEEPWRALVARAMRGRGGVRLDDLYREFAAHPRAHRNPHWQAKIRQTLQKGPFRRVGRGQWEMVA